MQHNNNDVPVFIEKIQLNQFRCFDNVTIDLNNPIVLIEGDNATGKTSLLEALHYTCYLRSFRTHLPKELVYGNEATFFIKILLRNQELHHNLQVGFSTAKRVVRIDGKAVASYKELMGYYRIISITEDDIELIKGAPELRRDFLDNALALIKPDFVQVLKKLRTIVEQRNGLLRNPTLDQALYRIWSEQLWQISREVQQERVQLLNLLTDQTNKLLTTYFDPTTQLKLTYRNKNMGSFSNFDEFWARSQEYIKREEIFRRSIFGAHLDDFEIVFKGLNSRTYSSRGQQKLVLFLLKIGLLNITADTYGSAILLVDDFMTDFDENRLNWLITILVGTKNQLIFTCPITPSALRNALLPYNPLIVKLTN